MERATGEGLSAAKKDIQRPRILGPLHLRASSGKFGVQKVQPLPGTGQRLQVQECSTSYEVTGRKGSDRQLVTKTTLVLHQICPIGYHTCEVTDEK